MWRETTDKMKRLLFFFLFVSQRLILSAQGQVLVLYHADHRTTEVELYTRPQITFEGDNMVITSSVLQMSFKVGDVLHFSYRENTTDIAKQNRRIICKGIEENAKIAVYKSDGTLVPIRMDSYNGQPGFSLSQLPTGVYILSINGRTTKIVRP